MTDLHERLIAAARWLEHRGLRATPPLLREAADEIERLRGKLVAAQERYIEASNPGIDMDDVRRIRGARLNRATVEPCSSSSPSEQSSPGSATGEDAPSDGASELLPPGWFDPFSLVRWDPAAFVRPEPEVPRS